MRVFFSPAADRVRKAMLHPLARTPVIRQRSDLHAYVFVISSREAPVLLTNPHADRNLLLNVGSLTCV